MSKFFTRPLGLLLASAWGALASEGVNAPPVPPSPVPEAALAAPPSSPGLPLPLASGRFAALGKKSPFTLASTTEENADFAKDLILGGYFRMDGKDFVVVANRTNPTRLMVGTQASAAAQGLTLVKVERDPSGDPTKLRAQVRKGTETAMLKYESAAAAGAPSGVPAGQPIPGQGVPGQPPVLGQPQPAQAQPGVPGQAPGKNPPVIRRRVIPIPQLPGR